MTPDPQLEMAWPARRRHDPPPIAPAPGYAVRPHRAGDEPRFFELMALVGWPGWDHARLRPWAERLLPGGWLMVVEARSGEIVASAMALRSEAFDGAGELGWLAGDPAHAGRGLGRAASAAVTERMLAEGCWPVHLYTEDWRLAALRTYFGLGYEPVLAGAGVIDRWRAVCAAVWWPCAPGAWTGWGEVAR
jgi:mycothiol synthase